MEDSRPIHLLLTDVVMSDLSGYKLAARLRTSHPQIKILYMSGYPDLGDKSEAIEIGLNFIPKPFTKETLLRKVREILDAGSSDFQKRPQVRTAASRLAE
jgi:DNA-binding response OmpR family regulator